MSDLAPNAQQVVGVLRHDLSHLGKMVTTEQRVYILHSQSCLDSGRDLRTCPFSCALDRGIDEEAWDGFEDVPVLLAVLRLGDYDPVGTGRLIPLKVMGNPCDEQVEN
jgi:hypothetical protein